MRAGQVALIVAVMVLPGLVRAQSATRAARVISVHPRVPTIFHLPEAIENAWITDRDDFELVIVGKDLYVRPRPGTRAGVEGSIEVKTAAQRRIFRVRVVARARDAISDVLVLSAEPDPGIEEELEEWMPGMIEEEIVAAPPAASEPANELAEPERAEEPAEPEHSDASAKPERANASAEPASEHDAAADNRRGDAAARRPRLDLSAHAVVALGVTAVEVADYEPGKGFQFHQAVGVRLAGARDGAWWALEVDLSGERLAGPLTYRRQGNEPSDLAVGGPWLRAMLGMRARLEPRARWIPSAYAGIGVQAHLRGTERLANVGDSSTMKTGGVLALGMGLQYRARDVLMGVEFRLWEGGPDEYRSIAALFTMGRFLGRGDEQ